MAEPIVNWQSVPAGHSEVLMQVVGAVVAGPVGSAEDDVGLATAGVVTTGGFVGRAEVVTTGGLDMVVGAAREVVGGLGAAVVVLGGAEEVASPGASGLGLPGRSGNWATMPVGAVARRVTAHSTKRGVALDSFMVERFSGGDMYVEGIRSETKSFRNVTGVKYQKEEETEGV